MTLRAALGLILVLIAGPARATEYVVAAAGGDFTSVQAGLDAAVAGDTVTVRQKPTPYFEKIAFPRSGSAAGGPITLRAFPGETPILDGTGVGGSDMVLIDHRSYVTVVGFEIRNNLGVTDGSGVRVLGSGSHIDIRQNRIHDIRGQNAMGITVYGTDAAPLSDLRIDGNEIFDCEPAPSEALTLNGNVTDFQVTSNVVRDVDNIGIDFIGGETDIQPDPAKVARSGVCRGNQVLRARSSYGGGFAGGIYVDGGRDLVIENNLVTESDLGLEVGAEHAGSVAQNITVRDNLLFANDKAGLVFGGFAASVGRVRNSTFSNNTCWHNDTLGAGFGELWIQYAEDNTIRNNLFVATAQNLLLVSEGGNVGNTLDYNLWFADAGAGAAQFVWNGTAYTGFPAYRAGTGQDAHSPFADPLLVAPAADFHLGSGSPAINAGDPAFVPGAGETDLDGAARVNGPRIDLGADEATVCGNGIVEAPEACDDGDPCTPTDACSAGTCAGARAPGAGCRTAAAGSFQITPTSHPLVWKWTHGAATSAAEFGDPAGAPIDYTLCVYDTAKRHPGPGLSRPRPRRRHLPRQALLENESERHRHLRLQGRHGPAETHPEAERERRDQDHRPRRGRRRRTPRAPAGAGPGPDRAAPPHRPRPLLGVDLRRARAAERHHALPRHAPLIRADVVDKDAPLP